MLSLLAFVTLLAVQDEANRLTDMWVSRMKDVLKLSDEQVAKVKEVYQKTEKERQDQVKGVLTDDQKKQYDELLKNPFGNFGRGSGGGGSGGRGNWGSNWLGFGAEQLKEPLGLSDDQVAKIKEVMDQFQKDTAEKFQGGNFNWREDLPKLMDELGTKVKEHLTPEQKEKYDKFVEDRTSGMRGGNRGNRGNNGRPSVEDRAKRVIDALKIADEKERGVVNDILIKVLKARDDVEDYDREYRNKIRDLARGELAEEAIEEQLKTLREERKKRDKGLSDARKELGEIVTFKQEVILVEQGILR